MESIIERLSELRESLGLGTDLPTTKLGDDNFPVSKVLYKLAADLSSRKRSTTITYEDLWGLKWK